MRTYHSLITLLVMGVAISACSTNSNHNVSTEHFIATAAGSDRFEIASSRLILSKSHDQAVKDIAQRLITDHQASTRQLKSIVASNGMPAPQPTFTSDQQTSLSRFKNERHFNGDYLGVQEKAHHDAINLFENYRDNGDNPALRDFAAKTLPTLKQHYDMIRQAISLRDKNNNSVFGSTNG